MKPFPYRDVFNAVEQRLVESGSDPVAIRLHLDEFKRFSGRQLSDDDYYWILVLVTFYSGFRAATVTSRRPIIRKHFPSWKLVAAYSEVKVQEILADREMISHERKIRACVKNAQTFGCDSN